MAEVDTSSYPKPQAPANPLDQILKVGQVADTLGHVEAGKAVQGAIGPDGEIDRNALAQALKGTVAGSMQAIPTLNAYETLRNAGHVADMAGADNFQKRMALINHLFGQLASKDNPSIQDINSIAGRILDPAVNGPKYGVTFPVVMNAIKEFIGPDGRPLSPAAIKKKALDMQTMTASTAEQLAAHSPRYSVVDDGNTIRFEPTGTEVNPRNPAITKRLPTGTPVVNPDTRKPELIPPQEAAPSQTISRNGQVQPFRSSNPLDGAIGPNSAVLKPSPVKTVPQPGTNALSGVTPPGAEKPATFAERFNPRMAGAPAAGLAPGVAAAATKVAENSAELGNQLTTAASEIPQTRAIIDNLDRTLDDFTSGPGADWTRVAKAFANTVLPESWQKEGSILDPKKIASQEEFNKLAYNAAQSQFRILGGTGTDAKLDSAMHTSPNELISKYGNKGILQLMKGNTDAIAAKAKAWNAWRKAHGEDSMPDFNDDFNQHFNPRVFQFKYIPKKDRQSWYKAMSPDDKRNFEDAADYALSKGWIKDIK